VELVVEALFLWGKQMKVLIACEFSGTVREAFAKLGHNAWSCDLEATDIPGQHYHGDIFDIINIRKGVILIDEINLSFPSRIWDKLPPQFLYFWSQTRKMGLDIYFTSQHPDRVDKVPKEISNWSWWVVSLPFGFHIARKYLPEHITKEKRKNYEFKIFHRNKNIMQSYNTLELIELPQHLLARFKGRQY